MFERYVEKARRVIFFGRYEASQYGSPYIETEHLLLALLREDKALAHRFLPLGATEAIRTQVDAQITIREKISTSVDLPLSHESKRVLAYAAEEAERMQHKHIETPHLLLGLLREEGTFAAQLLRDRGLQLTNLREAVFGAIAAAKQEAAVQRREPPEALHKQVRAWEDQGLVRVLTDASVGGHAPDFAIYAGRLEAQERTTPPTPQEELALIARKIKLVAQRMEDAIAQHEFEKARFYSEEERKLRESLRRLHAEHGLPEWTEPSEPAPVLCIEIVRDERFPAMRKRFADYLLAGVEQVWVLDCAAKQAYTVTAGDGLREFQGDTLRMTEPALELDLKAVFS